MRRVTAVGAAACVVAAWLVLFGSPLRSEEVPPPPAGTLTFTASGDIGSNPRSDATSDQVRQVGSELHLALGDLSYGAAGEEGAWCDSVKRLVGDRFPYELLAGNHESSGANGFIDEFAACLPNRIPGLVGVYARQYFLDVPAHDPIARLVMIAPGIEFPDAAGEYGVGSDGYAWTQEAIEGARAAGIPWVIVGMHKPCLSIGDYGCDPGADLVDLLVSQHVDLVLTGHEHLYQRSVQLALLPGCDSTVPGAIDPACVADRDDELAKGAGTVFVTVGTGGTRLRNVNAADPDAAYFAAWEGANAEPSWGNLVVRLDAGTLDAEFLPAIGTFTDRFRITADTTLPARGR